MGGRRKNKELQREYWRSYYAANRDRIRETNQRWRDAHRDSEHARHKRYRTENPKKVSAVKKRWQAENPEREKARSIARRAKKLAAEGTHTAADIKALWLKQGKKCAVPGCKHPISDKRGSPDRYHVDHIIPLKPRSGPPGTNWPENLQILCKTHNQHKRNRDPYE